MSSALLMAGTSGFPNLYVDGYPLTSSMDLDMFNSSEMSRMYLQSGRLLQSGEGGSSSETCRVIGLADTCCLTLTLLASPFLLSLFLIIKCRPANALISMVILSLTAAFLAYIAWVDFLRCVAALFILVVVQWLMTCTYLIRRRINYKSGTALLTQKKNECMQPPAAPLPHSLLLPFHPRRAPRLAEHPERGPREPDRPRGRAGAHPRPSQRKPRLQLLN